MEKKDRYSFKELWEEVQALSGVKLDAVPMTSQYFWPSPDGSMMGFTIGEKTPFKIPGLTFAIFVDDEVTRVYTLPAPEASEKHRVPKRYTFQSQGRYGVEAMSMETFIDEVAEEVSGMDPAADERAAVVAYLEDKGLASVAEEIRAGLHDAEVDDEEDDEEEDDEEEEETPPTPPEAPKPPALPTVPS